MPEEHFPHRDADGDIRFESDDDTPEARVERIQNAQIAADDARSERDQRKSENPPDDAGFEHPPTIEEQVAEICELIIDGHERTDEVRAVLKALHVGEMVVFRGLDDKKVAVCLYRENTEIGVVNDVKFL